MTATLTQLLSVRSRRADILTRWAEGLLASTSPSGWNTAITQLPLRVCSSGRSLSIGEWVESDAAGRSFLIEGEALTAKTELMRRIVAGRAELIPTGLRESTLLADDPKAIPPLWISWPEVLSIGPEEESEQLEFLLRPKGGDAILATSYQRALARVIRVAAREAGNGFLVGNAISLFWRSCMEELSATPSPLLLALDRIDDCSGNKLPYSSDLLETLVDRFPGRILATARALDEHSLARLVKSQPKRCSVEFLQQTTVRKFIEQRLPNEKSVKILNWISRRSDLKEASVRPSMLIRIVAWVEQMSHVADEHSLLNWCDFWQSFPDVSWSPRGRVFNVRTYREPRDVMLRNNQRPFELPFKERRPCFVGREMLLALLISRLAPGARQVVVGPGGFGKSALCDEAIRDLAGSQDELSPFPDGVVLLNLYAIFGEATEGAMNHAWQELASKFGERRMDGERPEIFARRVLARRVALIVIEGAERVGSQGDLQQLLDVLGPLCAALVTTRVEQHTWNTTFFREGSAIYVPRLGNAAEVIQYWAKLPTRPENADAFSAIANFLDGHPKAAELSGRYLALKRESPLPFLAALQSEASAVLHEAAAITGDDRAFGRVFRRVFANALDLTQRRMVAYAATLAPVPIAEGLLAAALSLPERRVGPLVARMPGILHLLPSGLVEFTHSLERLFAGEEASRSADNVGSMDDHALGWLAITVPSFVRQKVAFESASEVAHLVTLFDHARSLFSRWHQPKASGIPEIPNFGDELKGMLEEGLLQFFGSPALARGAALASDAAISAIWTKAEPLPRVLQEWRLHAMRTLGDAELTEGNRAGSLKRFKEIYRICSDLLLGNPEKPEVLSMLAASCGSLGDLSLTSGNLEVAQNYYEEMARIHNDLAQRSSCDSDTHRDLAVGFERLGLVYQNKGDAERARETFESSLTMHRRLSALEPDRLWFQHDIALSDSRLAILLESTGKLAEARAHLEEAIFISQKIVIAEPRQTVFQQTLASAQQLLADILLAEGNCDRARSCYREGHDLYKAMAARETTNCDFQAKLALSHLSLGNLLMTRGEQLPAKHHYSEVYRLCTRLLAQDPQNAHLQFTLCCACLKLGDLWSAEGNRQKELAYYLELQRLTERLVLENSRNLMYLAARASSIGRLGAILREKGHLEEARLQFEQLERAVQQLIELSPDDTNYRQFMVDAQEMLGDVCRLIGDRTGAHIHYEKRYQVSRRLVEQAPGHLSFQRNLAMSHYDLGDLMKSEGNGRGARQHLQQAIRILEELNGRDAHNTIFQRNLAIVHAAQGDLLLQEGQVDAAQRHFEQVHRISLALTGREPENMVHRNGLLLSHQRLGDLFLDLGDTGKAYQHYEDLRGLCRACLERDADHLTFRAGLALSHRKIGELLLNEGKVDEAVLHFDNALRVSDAVSESSPENIAYQRDLAVCHFHLGAAFQINANLQRSRFHFHEYHRLSSELRVREPTDVSILFDCALSNERLGDIDWMEGRIEAARERYESLFAIMQDLILRDAGNTVYQREAAASHFLLGMCHLKMENRDRAPAFFFSGRDIVDKLLLNNSENEDWKRLREAFRSQIEELSFSEKRTV